MENLLFTGDQARLKDSAVPYIFAFLTTQQVSTSRSETVPKRSQKEAAWPLDNVQYEIEVNSDKVVEKIKIDIVVNSDVCEDSKEVQCNLLCIKEYSIGNFQNNAEAVQYCTSFDIYEHFMIRASSI